MAEFTRQLLVGAESGYDDCLRRIEKVLEGAARLLERQDIAHKADFSFILGPPWEDHEARRAERVSEPPDDEMILSG